MKTSANNLKQYTTMVMVLLLVFPSAFCQTGYGDNRGTKGTSMQFRSGVLALADSALPMYKKLLDEKYCGPGCYTTYSGGIKVNWDQDISMYAIYREMTTVIHESAHGKNTYRTVYKQNGQREQHYLLLVDPDQVTSIDYTRHINSNLIAADMLKHESTSKIFRFNTYINTESNTSSNVRGIFGLIDEFSAYYHGTMAAYLLYHHCLEIGKDARATNMAIRCLDSYYAYYEFNAFIGCYLRYIKDNHPAIYHETISNTSLALAYNKLDGQFKQLVNTIETELNSNYHYTYYKKNADAANNVLENYQDVINEFKGN